MATDVTVAPTLGHPILLTQGGVGASPGYDAIDLRRMIQAASGGQEGVYDATGWEVRERAAGPNMTIEVDANVGIAQVKGESVTHQGPYVVAPHSAVITLDVATAHSTNPRVDMVILHVRDNTHDALGANDARVRILSGTATAGATLDNLNGSPSLPSNAIRLADVLVPAADTTISNSQIRDRRGWARGAFRRLVRVSSSITTTSISFTELDTAGLRPRIECSGVPLVLTLHGIVSHSSAGQTISFAPFVDGAATESITDLYTWHEPTVNMQLPVSLSYTLVPAAGSHFVGWAWRTSAATANFINTATQPISVTIAEQVRPDADNS